MREPSTQRIRWLADWAWRIGVSLTLLVTLVLAVSVGNHHFSEVSPEAVRAIQFMIDAGAAMMMAGLVTPAMLWMYCELWGVEG